MTATAPDRVVPDYDPGVFWDEMFEAPGVVRPHYATLARCLATLSSADVARRQRAAELFTGLRWHGAFFDDEL